MERLLDYFNPKNYNLSLNINKSTGRVYGTAIITGEPKKGEDGKPADEIKLHAKGLKITSVEVDGEPVSCRQEDDILIIKQGGDQQFSPASAAAARTGRSAPVKTGGAERTGENSLSPTCEIKIKYTFRLNTNMQGAYLSSYQYQADGESEPHTEYLVSTQFESHYARECFPCIDEPAAKATFDLKIITPDTDDTVISNMPAKSERIVEYESVDPNQDPHTTEISLNTKVSKKIVEFETTPRMSTYLLAFCLGKFHHKSKTNKHGVKVTTYCALNQDPRTLDFAGEIAADSLDYYDDTFKIKYPLPKLDQIAIPDFEAGAMENWGLITYRESCLLASPDESKTTKEYISTVIAHELSHQWFGNLVTMSWWDNLWLNESFANMMEYVCIDAIRPRYHIWEYFFTGDCRAALNRDALPGVQAVQQEVNDPAEIATLFDGAIVYAKGAHLMFMLMRLMGQGNFFKGLRDYFKAHKYGNTTGDDLWAALQPYADFEIKEFMDAWITQPGFPVITDDTQQRFLLTGDTDDTKWPLPEVTDDMSGHYIVNLSSEEFNEQIEKFDKLSQEQKIRLLIDRSLLAKTPLVSTATHLDLLPKFKTEQNYAIWSPVLGLVNDLKLFFSPEDKDYVNFEKYVLNLVSVQLKRVGLTPKAREDDNNSKVRQLTIGLALFSKDPEITSDLARMFEEAKSSSVAKAISTTKANPAANAGSTPASSIDYLSIHPDIRACVLVAAQRQNKKLWPQFLKDYQATADPNLKDDILSALTDISGDSKRLLKLLDQHDIIRPQDHLYLFASLLRNHHTRADAIAWLYSHWDDVVEMTGEKSLEDYPRVLATTIRTVEESKAFDEFFGPKKDNPVLTRTLEVASGEISARLRLISLDHDDVHRHLSELM